jgi:hypothetical protein
MKKMRISSRLAGVLLAAGLVLGLAGACSSQGVNEGLWARLTAANLLAGSVAQGLASATEAGLIAPSSGHAQLIAQTLDAVALSLDGAGTALRAGLPAVAESQIGAAESQLSGLQPLIPPIEAEGEAP